MIALVLLTVFALYLILTIVLAYLAARYAKRRGRRVWVWSGLVVFGMYNLVFWDWIPTIVTHKYRCATEAGYWVYNTPEQWMVSNPGVAETLRSSDQAIVEDGAYVLNERFRWVVKKSGPHPVNLWRHEQEVLDTKSREVMARYIDFSSGYGNPFVANYYGLQGLKMWLSDPHCSEGNINESQLRNLKNKFKFKEQSG